MKCRRSSRHSKLVRPARVRLHTNRRLLPAVVLDEPDTDEAGDFRGQIFSAVVIDAAPKNFFAACQNTLAMVLSRAPRGFAFRTSADAGDFGRVAESRIDGRLHVNRRAASTLARVSNCTCTKLVTERTRRNEERTPGEIRQ